MRRLSLLPITLAVVLVTQFFYTSNSLGQIRFEELSESVRNVWWYKNGIVFSGINAHLGWYGTLQVIYEVFGFDLHTAKYFRLVLHLVSSVTLFLVIQKYFDYKKGLVVFLTVILSPTILFFNTLNSHLGIDLSYLPVVIYLLMICKFESNKFQDLLPHFLLWSLAMFAWLSYPTFIYYIPALIFLYFYKMRISVISRNKNKIVKYSAILIFAFIFPLIVLSLPIKNKEILLQDKLNGGGLFRGAGEIQVHSLDDFIQRILATLLAFAGKGHAYIYEVVDSDFSRIFPLFAVFTVLFMNVYIFLKHSRFRIVQVAISSVILINLVVLGLTLDTASLASVRRGTGLLAAFYILFGIAWYFVAKLSVSLYKWLLVAVLFLLPIHHIIVYSNNLNNIKTKSSDIENFWFVNSKYPSEALGGYVEKAERADLMLFGVYDNPKDFGLVYAWVYSGVSSYCYWNNIKCNKILGFDESKNRLVPITLESVHYALPNYQYK